MLDKRIISLHDLARTFKSDIVSGITAASQFARSSTSACDFPSKVTYPRHCGALCSFDGPIQQRLLYCRLLKALEDVAKRFESAASLAAEDVILVFEQDGYAPVFVMFVIPLFDSK